MNHLIQWSARHPGYAMILAVSIALAVGLGSIRLDLGGGTEDLFADDAGGFARYEEFRANFGSDEPIVVMVSGPALFSEDSLLWLKGLSSDLEAHEEIRRVESPFGLLSYQTRGHWNFLAPLIGEIPSAESELTALRQAVMEDARSRGRLVDADGEALCFLIELNPEREAGGESTAVSEVVAICDEAAAAAPEGMEMQVLGVPLIHLELKTAIRRELAIFIPLSLLGVWLGTLPFLRAWTSCVPVFATAIIGAVVTLGLIGWAGFPLTLSLHPVVLLVVVISAAETVYLVAGFQEGARRGLSNRAAAQRLGPLMGLTLSLTSATSAIGFASVAITSNLGFQRFALVGAAGIGLQLFLTALLVPALLTILPPLPPSSIALGRRVRGCRARLATLSADRRRRVGWGVSLLLLGFAAGVPRIQIETSFLDYLPKRSLLHDRVARYREAFGGLSFVAITLETGEPGGALTPQALQEAERIQGFLESLGDSVHSHLDILHEGLRWQGKAQSAERSGLHREERWDEILPMIPPQMLGEFIDHDGSRACFKWRVHAPGSRDLLAFERAVLDNSALHLAEGFEVEVTGSRLMMAKFSDQVVRDVLFSLLLLVGIVAFLASVVWRSTLLGMVALVPNGLSVLATLGLMGWTGIPLGMGTWYVAVLVFAVAVNDTIHLVTRYRTLRKAGRSGEGALRRSLREIAVPASATSTALAFGFAVFCFGELGNIRQTGFLLVFAMFAALATDLLVTPCLLRWSDPERRRGPGSPG